MAIGFILLFVLSLKVFCNALDFNILNPNHCDVETGDCPNEHVSFWLYTNTTLNSPVKLDPLHLNPQTFQPKLPIKILIHGYTGHRDYSPSLELRPVLLKNQNVYIISVEYGALATEGCYLAGVENIPLVSKCLGQLINNLVEAGVVSNEDIHLIGFSLGAQVAGQTANYVHTKLKRITGLDPAQPFFIIASADKKLDSTDAEFVDVIHTDVSSHGLLYATGHVDFYFNWGMTSQPGCPAANGLNTTESCSHHRAVLYYTESVTNSRGFWGYECKSFVQLALGLCKGKTIQAGYFVNKCARGIYALRTSSKQPFALGRVRSKPACNFSTVN